MISISGIQTAINGMVGVSLPKLLTPDGVAGDKTMTAIELVLKNSGVKITNWSDERLRIAVEQLIYKNAGIEVGDIDGRVGEQTRYARTVWDARATGDKKEIAKVEDWRKDGQETKSQPKVTPALPVTNTSPPTTKTSSSHWPKQTAGAMDAFFGAKGTNQVTLSMPFPLRIAWDTGKTVQSFSCNQKVYPSMLRIWNRVKDQYGYEELRRLRLDMYGGCLNVRKMRGGSAWSIHSWGCAYDVDPDRNQLKFNHNSASLDGKEYDRFWEFVYDEGAISLGKERDYDWMHFQFARL